MCLTKARPRPVTRSTGSPGTGPTPTPARRCLVGWLWSVPRIGETLDRAVGGGPIRVLSLCAGDGRDVLAELAARHSLQTTTTLVELDDRLAAATRRAAAQVAGVEVRQGDAGDVATFVDVLPVDLLLLCGIFGNVSIRDVRATVAAVPSMLVAGGTVIWTRGWFAHDDLRPEIRRWFVDAGLSEVAFDGDPERFGVGVARLSTDRSSTLPSKTRLFSFTR